MKVTIKNKITGEIVREFEAKEKGPFYQMKGENFMTALVRHYYPSVFRRHQKMKAVKP